MIIDAKLLASDSQTHVNHPNTDTHPQGALWHRQCKETARVRAGSGQQLLDRGVTSNGTVQRHDVRFLVTNTAGGGHNLVAPLIDREPAAWGLREVGRDGPIRVYRVE